MSGSKQSHRNGGQWMLVAVLAMTPLASALAQTNLDAQEQLRQQERERALREQMEQRPDVREQPSVVAVEKLPANESPCFPIQRIALEGEGASQFDWALKAANTQDDPALGRCLGTEGINVVMKRVQNAIVARGYVTTRVLVAPQDVKSGALTLTVVPGRIRNIRFADGTDSRATAWNAMATRRGALLNLRDVEQSLENYQRLPTVAADIQIVPAEGQDAAPGESDLVISWQQRSLIRANVSLDDSGSEATGKWQAGATLSLDDWWMWNDIFYVNLGHSVFTGDDKKGTQSWTAHYDVPLGNWNIGTTASGYEYHQLERGKYEDYVYRGTSHNAEVRVSRRLFRNAHIKSGIYGRGWWRESDNFINDTEIEVQRRRMAGWELGLTYKHFLGAATLEGSTALRHGTGAFDALTPPEALYGEGTGRSKVILADATYALPFQWGKQALRYTASWRAQWNRTPLVPQERFAIGGRYSVRGYDGEAALTGDRGWLIRNELAVPLGGGQEFYWGVDYGHIGGPSTVRRLPDDTVIQTQVSDHLTGTAIGLRGGWHGFNWDAFIGAPINAPRNYPTAFTTFGVSLGWSY